MEMNHSTLVVLAEGNKEFVNGPEGACCIAMIGLLI